MTKDVISDVIFPTVLEYNINSSTGETLVPAIKKSVLETVLEEKNIIKSSSNAKFAKFINNLEINITEFTDTSVKKACASVFGAQYIVDMLKNPSFSFMKYIFFEAIASLIRSDSKMYHENSKALTSLVFLRNMLKSCLMINAKKLVEKDMLSEISMDVRDIEVGIEAGFVKESNLEGYQFAAIYTLISIIPSYIKQILNSLVQLANQHGVNWSPWYVNKLIDYPNCT